jgi:hypothetical protein
MGAGIKTKGVVVGHEICHLPETRIELGRGKSTTYARKIGAFLKMEVDGRSVHVRCRKDDEERGLDEAENPTPDICRPIYNLLAERYPLCSEQPVIKYDSSDEESDIDESGKKRKPKVRYALDLRSRTQE